MCVFSIELLIYSWHGTVLSYSWTHIPDEFKSARKFMCQLFIHKWSELLHRIWSFLYISYQLNFLMKWWHLKKWDAVRNHIFILVNITCWLRLQNILFSCHLLCIHNSVHVNAKTICNESVGERWQCPQEISFVRMSSSKQFFICIAYILVSSLTQRHSYRW